MNSCTQIFLGLGKSCAGESDAECVGIITNFTENTCQIDPQDPAIQNIFQLNDFKEGVEKNFDDIPPNDDDGRGSFWSIDSMQHIDYFFASDATTLIAKIKARTFVY